MVHLLFFVLLSHNQLSLAPPLPKRLFSFFFFPHRRRRFSMGDNKGAELRELARIRHARNRQPPAPAGRSVQERSWRQQAEQEEEMMRQALEDSERQYREEQQQRAAQAEQQRRQRVRKKRKIRKIRKNKNKQFGFDDT